MQTDSTNPNPNQFVPMCAVTRRPLTDKQIDMILGLVRLGCSRRRAAMTIGCSPSTISKMVFRNPDFAFRMYEAEQACEIIALKNIHKAAADPRYWRANAWLLERRNPDDFAPRHPFQITTEHLRRFCIALQDGFEAAVPEGKWDAVLEHFEELAQEFQEELESSASPDVPQTRPVTQNSFSRVPRSPSPFQHPASEPDEFADSMGDANDCDTTTSDVQD